MHALCTDEIRKMTDGELLCGREKEKVSYISIDSRDVKGGTLSVPPVDGKVDAHRFLEPVTAASAKTVFATEVLTEVRHEAATEVGTAVVRVADTLIALRTLADWLRSRPSLPSIGVTGSVGKTTTHEMIAVAPSAKYWVFKTKADHDSQIGVPLTLLDIEDEEIGVTEMGTSHPGEMHIISELVCLAAAVITNIGAAHFMKLGSRESIRDEKLKIQDGIQKGTLLSRDVDDAILLSGQARGGVTVCTCGPAEGTDCCTENVNSVNGYAEFTANIRDKRVAVRLGVSGEHQVLNTLAALGVTEAYGVLLVGAAAELEEFRGYRHRQQIFERDGVLAIDDSYNANPASMRAVLSVLHEMKSRRRIAVLGDTKELDEAEKELHREIGAELAAMEGAECLYTLDDLAVELVVTCRERYDTDYRPELRRFSDRESLFAVLKETVKPGDALLFKVSNSMRFSELADYFSGQRGQGVY